MINYPLIALKQTGLIWLIGLFLSGCATNISQQNQPSIQPYELSSSSYTNQINDLLIVDCAIPITGTDDFKPIRSTAKNCRSRDGIFSVHGTRDDRIKIWGEKAQQGDAIAQNYVGEIYEKGIDQEPDYSQAQKWYQMAAKQGFHRAQTNLAFFYQNGLGVEEDPKKALYWYKRAAEFDATEILIVRDDAELRRLRQTIKHKSQQLKRMRQELKDTLKQLNAAVQALKHIQGAPVPIMAKNEIDSDSLQESP